MKKRTNIYSGVVCDTLKDRLAKLAEDPEARESLVDEVDASRILAEQAMVLFNAAFYGKTTDGKEISVEVKAMALEAMRTSLKHVADMTNAMRKLKLTNPEFLAVQHLPFISGQIANIIAKHLGRTNPLLQVIADEIAEIRLPDSVAPPQVNITLD